MKDVSGKVAFVTGAASGIGLGIAKALARAGANVMLCDIEEEALARAVEALKPSNAEIASVKADVSLKPELRAAADATLERFGAVSILVNNAGVGGGGPYGLWNDALWDWTLGVNLMSVIWGVEIFGPLIEKTAAGTSCRRRRSPVCSRATACRTTSANMASSPFPRGCA